MSFILLLLSAAAIADSINRFVAARFSVSSLRLTQTFLVTAGIALLVVAGCSQDQAQGGGFTPPPMPVETASVTSSTVVDQFDAVGTIEAINAITVVSEIDALVRDIPFEEGARIKKGQLIAQLDDVQAKAELSRVEALRDQQQVTFNRVKSLADRGAVAPQEYDNALANLKVAQANVDFTKARLEKTKIVAPFDGVIGARRVSPGAFLRTGDPITDLAQISELKVTFAAPERYYPLLQRKSEVLVRTNAYADYTLKGTLEVVEPMVDPTTRSAKVIAHVNNPELKFRPGMSANVAAVLSSRENAMLIPDEAIFAEGDQLLVFVINSDSTVARKPVSVGTRQAETVEIVQGLEPGQTVVKAGHQKLFEGAKVMPIPTQAAAAGAPGGNQ